MIVMQGNGISKGAARGRVRFLRRPGGDVRGRAAVDGSIGEESVAAVRNTGGGSAAAQHAKDGSAAAQHAEDGSAAAPGSAAGAEAGAEKARFGEARRRAAEQLRTLAQKCRGEAGEEAAALLEAQAMLAEDESFAERVTELLEDGSSSAESAVRAAGEEFSAVFGAMEDEYMRARAEDILDVAGRIFDNLTGEVRGGTVLEEPVILAADNLSPSELLQLDRSRLLGLLLQGGSGNSHTAILARGWGIPAVCGLGEALKPEYDGKEGWIDGETGQAVLDPDGASLAAFGEKVREQREREERLSRAEEEEDTASGGQKPVVCCNIAFPEEAEAALGCGARGIGLFRTEFLCIAAGGFPSEEEQFEAYRAAAAAMCGRRVVIRTFDLGEDKQPGCFKEEKERGERDLRGIRLSLEHPEMFRTQLRAICRASACGRVAVLFPMITSVWEVRECRRICAGVMAELDAEGIPHDEKMEAGIMIETPASVLIADELAREADFFSIGTNDLTQYTLACSRQSGQGRFFDARHPAILRAMKTAADAAHAAGIRVCVCGELASDPAMLGTFRSLGIEELSVPPAAAPALREAVRKLS